jgi:hypothetical protein
MDPSLRELLRDAERFGVRVEFTPRLDACPTCQRLIGIYEPRDAPIIPVPDCENEACRCDYLPFVT